MKTLQAALILLSILAGDQRLCLGQTARSAAESSSSWFAMGALLAQADAEPAPAPTSTAPAVEETPWLIPYTDYRGDLWHRPALTGDWGGLRQQLMDKGMRFDLSLTQTLQRNWAGGVENECCYQGGIDLIFELDTGKAGLWPGGLLKVKGEGRYGQSDNLNTGAIIPINIQAICAHQRRRQ